MHLDPGQLRVAHRLEALAEKLRRWRPGWLRLLGRRPSPPRGIYIWGEVGRGKTMLMDRFFEAAEITPKRRLHFNAFMVETHARLHEWRSIDERGRMRRAEFVRDAGDDPVPPIARAIAMEARLLCFDEFQVNDVADAMILGRLFEQLIAREVIIVATSNSPPVRLYENGLNRQLFLPFIALIEKKLDVVELAPGSDYRLGRMAGLELYVTPLGPKADAALNRAWSHLVNGAAPETEAIKVLGRTIIVHRAANGTARFSFEELCGQPLAAADYLALARRYEYVVIDRIPRLGPERRDEARRFTVLIDTLYDEGVKLVCSAAAAPQTLFIGGDEAAAFRRTASRLAEMQSADYLCRGRPSRRASGRAYAD